MIRQTKAVSTAADRVVAALMEVVQTPGTAENRQAAEAIVALRRCFEYDGRPDWAGRSGVYRDMIERLYRQAGVPSDSAASIQANLRYHTGNVLREIAPPEDLAALGMATDGPLSRVRGSRKAKRPAPVLEAGDPASLALLALSAIRLVGSQNPGRELEPVLRDIINETMNVLTHLA